MTMYCQFCGTQLRQLARYCKNCGAKVVKEDDVFSPVPAREFVPAQDDGDVPWRPDEAAIILPIQREAPQEDPWGDEAAPPAEIVPIEPLTPSPREEPPSPRVQVVEAAPAAARPAPAPPAPQREEARAPRPEIQEYFASVASRREPPAPRETRSAMPLLILFVAVLLLFFFAFLVWRGV
ncbi:MAG: zinc ribbon domain-containing protein [Blastocatellia bacterium]|nr:zinc ribbon domain-containing protein [Blastocatellia bacterium]